jgi:hypothetical protein
MTRPLQVLLLESHPSTGEAAAAALAAAGHEVVRCHSVDSPGFPCIGLTDREACPLRHGIDVAVDVRRSRGAEPSALEDGVGCALRSGVPVVEITDDAAAGESPFGPWTMPGTVGDIVATCEAASQAGFEGLRQAIVEKLEPLFAANGVPPCSIDCEIERNGRGLLVHLIGPPVGPGLRQAASVRAYDAVRAGDRSFEDVRLAYRPVVPA